MITNDLPTTDTGSQIMQNRARLLAQPLRRAEDHDFSLSFLEFHLESDSYAIAAHFVREVVPTTNLTPLPGTPPFIRGILSVRGLIWSVTDLNLFYNIPKRGLSDFPRAILVEVGDLRLGILTDSYLRIIHPSTIKPPPAVTERIPRNVVRGIVNDVTLVLDLEVLVKDPRLIVYDDTD